MMNQRILFISIVSPPRIEEMESIVDTVAFVKKRKQKIFEELENISLLPDDPAKKQKFEEMFLQTEEIKKHIHQHLPIMISHEIRVCNDLIKEIDSKMAREREKSQQKPFKFSFGFKNMKREQVNASHNKDDQIASLLSIATDTCGLKDLSNEDKILNSDELDSKEIIMDTLTNCTVKLQGAPSVLRLINVRNSLIYCGPVSSSAFIVNCHGCQLRIAGQQLRIHDTTDCDIYQHVVSRTIIENCSKLRFGRYDWNYEGLNEDFHKSRIDQSINNWTQIDDFDCLTNPSPNWSLIES